MPLAVNAETYVLIKERARESLEYDGTYLQILFKKEIAEQTRLKSNV